MNIQSSILSRFEKNRGDKVTQVPLNIQSFEVSGAVARCVVQIPEAYHRRLGNDEIAASVEKLIPQARYLNNSLTVADRKSSLFTIFLSSNEKVMDAEMASANSLHEVAHNVFRDDDDCIWNKVEDASGTYFVAQGVEDFAALIQGVRARNIATASLEVANAEGFKAGDMLAVYDPKAEGYRFALAVDTETAYFRSEDKIEAVSPNMVVVNHESAAKVETAGLTAKDVLAYYRKLYGHNPAYFKKLEGLIKAHMAV